MFIIRLKNVPVLFEIFSQCTPTRINGNCTSKMASICHTQHYEIQMAKKKINSNEFSFVNITLCCSRRRGRWSLCISFEENDTSFPHSCCCPTPNTPTFPTPFPPTRTAVLLLCFVHYCNNYLGECLKCVYRKLLRLWRCESARMFTGFFLFFWNFVGGGLSLSYFRFK